MVSGNNNQSGGPSVQVLFNNPVGTSQTVAVAVAVTKCNEVQRDTIFLQVTNAPTFTMDVSDDDVCSEDPVYFTLNPTPTSGSINWDFGDGATIPGTATTSHPYGNAGAVAVYYPTVTINQPNGCPTTAIIPGPPISVKPSPIAHITPETIAHCGTFSDNLTTVATPGYGGSNNFEWYYNGTQTGPNCQTCTSWNPISNYGTYWVVISNSNGCTSTSNQVPVIEDCVPPVTCTGSVPALVSSNLTFNDCSTINEILMYSTPSGVTVNNQYWTLPGAMNNPNHTEGSTATASGSFDAAGNYTLYYTVEFTNANGPCEITFPVNVWIPYVGDMLYEVSCGTGTGYDVKLYDHSNVYPTVVSTLSHSYYIRQTPGGSWQSVSVVPNTNDLQAEAPSVAPGDYDLMEVISIPGSVPCSTIVSISLPAKPVAGFNITMTPNILPPNFPCQRDVVIHFNNTTTPASGNTYVWTFGDNPNTNFQTSPSKVYDQSSVGTGYNVILTVTNSQGCTATTTQNIKISYDPYWDGSTNPNLSISPTAPPCQGIPVSLSYFPPSGFLTTPPLLTWYQGNTALTPAIGFGPYSVTQPGGYRAIGSDADGCSVPSSYIITDFKQTPAAVIRGDSRQQSGRAFTLNGYAGNIPGLTYEWRGTNGAVAGTEPELSQTLPAGVYTYTLTLKLNDCQSASLPFTVTVSDSRH